MASGVNDNLAEGFFKVTVNPWGQGKGDDCLWNIAVGVLAREGNDNPTVQEINDTIEAIKENNNKADGYHIREDNIIYAKQEILVPLEDAIAGIKEKVNTLTSEYNTLKSQYDSYCDELSGINLNVFFKKQAYDEACEAYSKYPSGANIPAKTNAEKVMNEAKDDYETALEALEAHKQKIDDTSALLGEKNNEINAFKEDLEVYIDDYDDSKETLDEQLKEVAGYITEIDDETDGLLKELNDLYNELNEFGNDAPNPESNDEYAKAQEYLSNGVQDGVLESNDKTAQTTYPDEFASDSALTSYVIDKNTGKNRDYVNDTSMSADGKKYTITFNDGRKITYTKDEETGKWVQGNPTSSNTTASNWTGYYKDPNTGEQRDDVKEVKPDGTGGRNLVITYSNGSSVTIDKTTGNVINKTGDVPEIISKNGESDSDSSDTNDDFNALKEACKSVSKDKNDDIADELVNLVDENEKAFSEILNNLDASQKKAVAAALSDMLNSPDDAGYNKKVFDKIQEELEKENSTGSVTKFINEQDNKDEKNGLTLAEKWQRYNCCKYLDDDNFSTFVENSGNSELTKDKIAASTNADDFRSVKELYDEYEEYKEFAKYFESIHSQYQEIATDINNEKYEKSTEITNKYHPGYYMTQLTNAQNDYYSELMLNSDGGEYCPDLKYNADNFIEMCKEMLELLGKDLEDFK